MACNRCRRDSGSAPQTGRTNALGPIVTILLRPAEGCVLLASQHIFRFANPRPISALL